MSAQLTAVRARELLSYDPETGVLTRKVTTGSRSRAGQPVAGLDAYGYLRVCGDGRSYKAHRVAWLIVTGAWSTGDVDHIDGVPSHNSWRNLRDVAHSVNQQNQRGARADSKTGFLGVVAAGKRFTAYIRVGGPTKYLGSFDTPEEAHTAYIAAKRQFHSGCTI